MMTKQPVRANWEGGVSARTTPHKNCNSKPNSAVQLNTALTLALDTDDPTTF